MSARVHPTAIVDSAAELGDGVEIGPYCCVGGAVRLADGVALRSHVVVDGRTAIGPRTEIYPFASIGLSPQDMKFRGELSELVVGADNTIREYVTMNPGTEGGGMVTRVGDNCLFMVGAHVAHDCQVGDHVIMANNATFAGHVTVGDHAIFGGLSAVHQFVRIGAHAMIGGVTTVRNDVIPYGSVIGDRSRLAGLNLVGLKRRGFSKQQLHSIRAAFRLLFVTPDEGTVEERLEAVAGQFGDDAAVMKIVKFMRADSSRGLTRP
jgi:UDP-N-acetylglucosamine acyltransferase